MSSKIDHNELIPENTLGSLGKQSLLSDRLGSKYQKNIDMQSPEMERFSDIDDGSEKQIDVPRSSNIYKLTEKFDNESSAASKKSKSYFNQQIPVSPKKMVPGLKMNLIKPIPVDSSKHQMISMRAQTRLNKASELLTKRIALKSGSTSKRTSRMVSKTSINEMM